MGLAPDVLIDDRYRLVERIAVGSTGQVWRAADLVLTRQVAVKILHPERLDDPMFRQRFRAEARHAAQLSHPGVAEVHDYGEQGDCAFLVMEYLPGKSLAAILEEQRDARIPEQSGRGQLALSLPATLEIVAQVARALQAAHDIGLIHRDIKPANLIVSGDGDVKITDFGTARALDASTVTEPGVVVGTAQYLSPEQAAGSPLTPAADIYALGVVAYTCLAGDPPFGGPSPVEIAAAHVHEEPPTLPQIVPAPVRELIEDCLAKDPEERPASAAEVAGRCVASRSALPRPTTVAEATPRRRPAPLSAATAGAAVAIGAMILVGPGYAFLAPASMVDDEQIGTRGGGTRPEPLPEPASAESSTGTGQRFEQATSPRPSPPVTGERSGQPRASEIPSATRQPPRAPVAGESRTPTATASPTASSPSATPSPSLSQRRSGSPAPTESPTAETWGTDIPTRSPSGSTSPTPSYTSPDSRQTSGHPRSPSPPATEDPSAPPDRPDGEQSGDPLPPILAPVTGLLG